jgi:hypothetical protein
LVIAGGWGAAVSSYRSLTACKYLVIACFLPLTWKRIKIVDSLIVYGNKHYGRMEPFLEPLRRKLRKLKQSQDESQGAGEIEEAAGIINPNEPDVLQTFRRKMRLEGKAQNTELV